MKFYLYFTLFIFSINPSSICFAQVKTFGEVSLEEFEAKHPEQAAEILFDQITFFYDYPGGDIKLNKERHIRILINTTEGFDLGNVFIPHYTEKLYGENILKIKASTYQLQENGQIKEFALDKKEIYEDRIDENRRAKRFALANIQEGCIIEYTYLLESDYLADIRSWVFQDAVPVHWSECNVKMPPFFEFFVHSENIDSFHIKEEKKEKLLTQYMGSEFYNVIYRWVLKDIKPWQREALITTISDYYPKLNFQISKFTPPRGAGIGFAQDWSDFSKDLLTSEIKGYRRHLSASKPIKELAKSMEESVAGMSDLDKMIQIRQFVANQFQFNGEKRLEPEHSQKDFLRVKKGNAGDINMLLFNLLEQHGLDVQAVILSTTDHGRVNTNFPFKGDYNYFLVRCQIESTSYLLDATNPRRPYNLLPPYCLTDRALVLEKKDAKWIGLPYEPASKFIRTCSYVVEDQIISGRATWSFDNHLALSKREEIFRKGESQFKENLQKDELSDFTIEGIEFSQKNDYDKPVKIKADFKEETESEDLLYLPPFPKLDESLLDAFANEDRLYPIHWDFLREYIFNTRIILKGNYEVIEYPKSTSISFPDGSVQFSLNSIYKNNILSIRYELSIQSLDYYKDAYEAFKELFDMIAEKQSEYIVIKRKT